ncbi:kinesin-like protein KLP2 [Haemaphysalis longicornis]
MPERSICKSFTFDKVFGPDTEEIDVYQAVMGPTIAEVMMSYNCTVFAYGQTGTGKTFTMEGERSNANLGWAEDPSAGIISRTLQQLFEELQSQDLEFTIRVSFLELYNEELFDLLSEHEDTSRLKIYEDSTRKASVARPFYLFFSCTGRHNLSQGWKFCANPLFLCHPPPNNTVASKLLPSGTTRCEACCEMISSSSCFAQ